MKKPLYTICALTLSAMFSLSSCHAQEKKENHPPVISGFVDLQHKNESLDKVSIIKGEPLSTKFIEVSDPDLDMIKLQLEKITKVSYKQTKSGELKCIERDADYKKQHTFFWLKNAGKYKVYVKATDGKATVSKGLEVLVRDSSDILNRKEDQIYNSIRREEFYLRDLAQHSSFEFSDLVGLLGAESHFNNHAISNKNAFTWAQLTYTGIRGLEDKFKRDYQILKEVFDMDKVDAMTLDNYTADLEGLDFKKLGFNKKRYWSTVAHWKVTEDELKYVILPTYVKLRSFLGTSGKVDRKKLKDKGYSARMMTAILEKNYIEMSSLQAIKDGNRWKWIYRPQSHFEKYPNTRAFTKLDVLASYNAGIEAMKRKYLKEAKRKRYDPMRRAAHETKVHRSNYKKFKDFADSMDEKLQKYCYMHQLVANMSRE